MNAMFNMLKISVKFFEPPYRYPIVVKFILPFNCVRIAAGTGLCFMPVQYKRKARAAGNAITVTSSTGAPG